MKYNSPLLTIAIPTYNRASILNVCLEKLLPQINNYENEIEIIISDNASTDNTQEIINYHKNKFPAINFITNLQPFNTGYYGNFRKCRELSNGRYLWLLSDNEHIFEGVIKYLLGNILLLHHPGAIYFLNDGNEYSFQNREVKDFFCQPFAYKVTLISSVIVLNEKQEDDYIFKEFYDNSFLGFLFFISGVIKNKIVTIISGKVFQIYPSIVSFNVFITFSNDINYCLDFMITRTLVPAYCRTIFINDILKYIIYYYLLMFLLGKYIPKERQLTKTEIKELLYKYYANNNYFNSKILPLFNKTHIELITRFWFYKIRARYRHLLKILRQLRS